jgi:hypothetical protein
MKIGILIPTTSNGRNWTSYRETYLYNITLKSFLLSTLFEKNQQKHSYTFYIGIDRHDRILDTDEYKFELNRLIAIFNVDNIEIKYFYTDGIMKGHLTLMWNRLFDHALKDGNDYFFQCGDDIEFKTKGWIDACIKTLQMNNDIGLTGPHNNNSRILTQSFVSRKHYDLFGYYFPEEIINWFCDDWINEVYRGLNAFFPLNEHLCINIGGEPRYKINNEESSINFKKQQSIVSMRNICTKIVNRDLLRVNNK